MDGGVVPQIKASTTQQKRDEAFTALQYAACCHCLVEEWQGCEELTPSQKRNDLCGQESGSSKTSNGVVCGCKQIPLYEMEKKQ